VADPVIGVDLLPTAYDHRLGIHYFDGHYLFMRSSIRLLVSATLLVVGVIHLLPLSGVLGGARLVSLYGVPIGDPNMEILMRHRAVLFGLLGAFLIYAAVKPPLQGIALLAGLISVASFMILAWSVGGFNAQLATVFKADVVALGCLAIGVIAWWRATASRQPV
jgi:hypothetical protein